MKKKILILLAMAVLLAAIPSMWVSAKTIVVRVRADVVWVETGIYVEAGESFTIKTHGIAWTGSPSIFPDSVHGPEGGLWTCSGNVDDDDNELPCNLNGAPYGALIGMVDDVPFLIGDAESFVAPASGELLLGVNDDLIYHDDNQAGFTVQFK